MDADSWTPAKGWMIGLGKALLRTVIVAAVQTGVFYLAWPINDLLPAHWSVMAVLFLVSAAVGYPMGYCIVRKLTDDSGIAGKSLILPVLIMVLCGMLLAFEIASQLRGPNAPLIFSVGAGVGFWAALATMKTLLLE